MSVARVSHTDEEIWYNGSHGLMSQDDAAEALAKKGEPFPGAVLDQESRLQVDEVHSAWIDFDGEAGLPELI